MASVVNERDRIMQQSALRVVPVQPTEQVIVAGLTGIKVVSDNGYWASGGDTYPYRVVPNSISQGRDKETIAAQLTGIAAGTPVTWVAGVGTQHWDAAKAQWIQDSFTVLPSGYGDYRLYTGIIITPTPDPLVVTVNAASYPKSQPLPPDGNIYHWMGGGVCARVTWGGTLFWQFKTITIGM